MNNEPANQTAPEEKSLLFCVILLPPETQVHKAISNQNSSSQPICSRPLCKEWRLNKTLENPPTIHETKFKNVFFFFNVTGGKQILEQVLVTQERPCLNEVIKARATYIS